MRLFFGLLVPTFLAGCAAGYDVRQDRVDFIWWDEGSGKNVKTVKGADPATFEKISSYHGKDQRHVYWRALPITHADPNSFKNIDLYYAVDARQAYLTHRVLEGSDSGTFEYIGDGWAKDKDSYFYGQVTLDVCDFETFEIVSESYSSRATDSQCYYWRGERVDIYDISTLELLGAGYARDSHYVYSDASIIKSAEPDSFEVLRNRYPSIARDAKNCFAGTRILACDDLDSDGREFCRCGTK